MNIKLETNWISDIVEYTIDRCDICHKIIQVKLIKNSKKAKKLLKIDKGYKYYGGYFINNIPSEIHKGKKFTAACYSPKCQTMLLLKHI